MFNAYVLAGIGMVFWGIAPLFGKMGLNGTQPLIALTLRSLIVSVILVVTVTVAGQWGNLFGVTAKDMTYIGLEGICAALLGQLAYYYALKFGEVSQVAPIVAAFPVVALFLGAIFLGEQVTFYKVVATFLIIAGIVLLKY